MFIRQKATRHSQFCISSPQVKNNLSIFVRVLNVNWSQYILLFFRSARELRQRCITTFSVTAKFRCRGIPAVGTWRDKETVLILSNNGECVILSFWESSALLSVSVKRNITSETVKPKGRGKNFDCEFNLMRTSWLQQRCYCRFKSSLIRQWISNSRRFERR
jgi:hypothetical protein